MTHAQPLELLKQARSRFAQREIARIIRPHIMAMISANTLEEANVS